MDFLLTVIIFLPLVGGSLLLLFRQNEENSRFYHYAAAAITGLTFLLSLVLLGRYQNDLHSTSKEATFQFIDQLNWMSHFNIQYQVGVDGLSLPMVVLTTLIALVAVFASRGIVKNPRLYFFLFLVMETGVLGVFTSLDLFLFFVMWELELIPMYFLIGMWGGPRREYAAIKFILYTMLASAFMFIAIICIYNYSASNTFDVIYLLNHHREVLSKVGPEFKMALFIGLFLCFAVKLPMFPFHTWLPDAHVEAPTPISVVLAGVLLKMGAYGIIRFNFGFFPELAQQFAVAFAFLGMVNILYGAFLALAQTDMKRVIAYSSISHMGFVLLGLAAMNAMGMNGAILQMFTHGTITALLFLFVGVVYDRTHTREIADLGGLCARMPLASGLFVVAALAAVGAPGMSGFVSEFLIFVGTYSNTLTAPVAGLNMSAHVVVQGLTITSALGIILGAAYMLWLGQRVFFGPLKDKWSELKDLNRLETINLLILTVFVVVIGLYPALIVDYINPASERILSLAPKE